MAVPLTSTRYSYSYPMEGHGYPMTRGGCTANTRSAATLGFPGATRTALLAICHEPCPGGRLNALSHELSLSLSCRGVSTRGPLALACRQHACAVLSIRGTRYGAKDVQPVLYTRVSPSNTVDEARPTRPGSRSKARPGPKRRFSNLQAAAERPLRMPAMEHMTRDRARASGSSQCRVWWLTLR